MILDKNKIIRIAITGPESTGKSTLSKQLAEHYNTVYVQEIARSYIEQLESPYEKNDLIEIAKGQIHEEELYFSKANELLICDTELMVIKIWSIHKFGEVDPFIISEINKRTYDLYLLMNVDLPWVADPQREHPENRNYFFKWFEKELSAIEANYRIIYGNNKERLSNAIRIIDDYMLKNANT